FFSSRRRHTRLVSDWSSDVCSSDLSREAGPDAHLPNTAQTPRTSEGLACSLFERQQTLKGSTTCQESSGSKRIRRRRSTPRRPRSEERRVGKEGRSRGWAGHLKEEQ